MNKKHENTVPMSSPEINDDDRQAVLEVLNTTSLSMGPKIDQFERSIRQRTGSRYALGVSSGTSGLHLCVRAAGIEQNDLVITTPFSFISSTNVILFEKATPVFVDVDLASGNLNTAQLQQAVYDIRQGGKSAARWLPRKNHAEYQKLKAVLSVDVFGQPADYDIIRKICDDNQLVLIEDSCEALGAEYKGKQAGTFGNYGVFAFYPNKQITTGEGGVIVTDDEAAAAYMQALRNQGRAPGDAWLQHTYLGYNYRLDEMSAALGYSQMSRLDHMLDCRARVAAWYQDYLQEFSQIETPHILPTTTRMSWFVYVIRVSGSMDRDAFAKRLIQNGIDVRPYFLPIHLQPYIADQFGYRPGDFPVTEDLGNRGLALPFSSVMTEEEVLQVCEGIRRSL
ncbi:MAG TPA: DegT/DnrJ/EryC1/StrS family aminotransferase [Anaerolineaceae bacterium]|jgi:perosamine synthetase|nr:DegT/DnrJ/EryC1/StrS family aminotransferase [Anaerolineaceae bacterium]